MKIQNFPIFCSPLPAGPPYAYSLGVSLAPGGIPPSLAASCLQKPWVRGETMGRVQNLGQDRDAPVIPRFHVSTITARGMVGMQAHNTDAKATEEVGGKTELRPELSDYEFRVVADRRLHVE